MSDIYEDSTVIRKRAASKFVTYFVVGALLLYMLATSTMAAYNAFQSTQTRQTLVDCVTPEGRCAQRGQAAQARAVEQLIDASNHSHVQTRHYSILAAGCAADPAVPEMPVAERIEFIDACVLEQLRREEKDEQGKN